MKKDKRNSMNTSERVMDIVKSSTLIGKNKLRPFQEAMLETYKKTGNAKMGTLFFSTNKPLKYTFQEYIEKDISLSIHKLTLQKNCHHSFKKFGFGYECRFCLYYTGENKKINDAIRKELNP